MLVTAGALLLEIITNPITHPSSNAMRPAQTPSRRLVLVSLDRKAATSSTMTPRRKISAVAGYPAPGLESDDRGLTDAEQDHGCSDDVPLPRAGAKSGQDEGDRPRCQPTRLGERRWLA
jgi:hypothetical protein